MATYNKRGKRWRAQVRRRGHAPESQAFNTKSEAIAWATGREAELLAGKRGFPAHTLGEAMVRYAKDVSPTKRGARWEKVRLIKLGRHPIAQKALSRLGEADLAAWRDEALQTLAPASVKREMGLLGSVLEVCRREWRWIGRSPLADVRKPSAPPARRRGVAQHEIDAMIAALGLDPALRAGQVAIAFLLAIETGMRAGEILGLTWDRVNLPERFVTLPRTKNGDQRDVPLSTEAGRLLGLLDGDRPFTMSSGTMDTLFRRARTRAGIPGLHFHDSRSEAVTRLAKRLSLLDLARAIGHRDLKSLQMYYAESASEIAKKLD